MRFLAWLASYVLGNFFERWRRDGELKDLGAAEQANKSAAEAEKRGQAGDAIDRKIEGMTDEELAAMLRGDK